MELKCFFIVLWFQCMLICEGNLVFECPEEWVTFTDRCYYFVMFPMVNHDDARVACGYHGASLVGVATRGEDQFISSWLVANDLARNEYYTSGYIKDFWSGDMVWESDGSQIQPDLDYWLSEEELNKTGNYLVYKYGVTRYGWARSLGSVQHPYICEIKREESFRIVQNTRGFDYGLNITDPNEIPFGPHFTVEPYDFISVGDTEAVSIECVVTSNPQSQYSIYHNTPGENETLITSETDNRFSVTNGKLTIYDPNEENDLGEYHCHASNIYGTVLGKHMKYSFGYLAEFSNVEREPVRVEEYHYGVIDCVPPNHSPALAYIWIKGDEYSFVSTELNPHIFISFNGRIYFAEVTRTDEDVYRCLVKLISNNQAAIGNDQAPSRISLKIPLTVTHSLPKNWGPDIGDDFIAAFPKQPKRGQQVRLECLAFGTLPIHYNWKRKDGLPLSPNAYMSDHNRLLYIDNVQLEDSTTYICEASRGSSGEDSKEFFLTVESQPYFIFPLQDKHVDIGGQITWRCEAKAQPKQEYTWYKNGIKLLPIPDEIEISQNVLVIRTLDAGRHDGMYQCRAWNIHGDAFSSGQLRVLSFIPTFDKHPLEANSMGSVGGNTTIICEPEAAPFPTFTWLKNGQDLGLIDGDTNSRIRKMRNGNLLITQVMMSDSGLYTCRAENINGIAESSGNLKVVDSTVITVAPSNVRVLINNTAFMSCEASHNVEKDLIITWRFNNRPINVDDGHYRMENTGLAKGLYILQALYRHEGTYTCVAKTSFDFDERSAVLTVQGPPAEPAGVYVDSKSITLSSMVVWWTPSFVRPVIYYRIEALSNFETNWTDVVPRIEEADTVVDGYYDKRRVDVTGLNPGTNYLMRVRAGNVYGLGDISISSGSYTTPSGPPQVAPTNITGAGGKVGDLHVIWKSLDRGEHGGDGIGYNFYWRLKADGIEGRNFLKASQVGDHNYQVVTVGSNNYYLQYDVMVQAFNNHGVGPNSSVVTVYSAEELPIGTPLSILSGRYNATALNVSWTPVPDNREYMKGRVLGYQINYWKVNESDPRVVSASHVGQIDSYLIIGLEPSTMYEMDVQVYNTAGLGPKSEKYRQRTWSNAPLLYPTEIRILSHGPSSAKVSWRGVTTISIIEEPLRGYVVRYWVATDNIRTAYDLVLGRVSEAVIHGIEPGQLYKLRVFGFSEGGDGKMSPDLFFTLGGAVRIDPETSEIIAAGDYIYSSISLLIISLTIIYIINH